MTLIYKKWGREDIRNWRPVTLLNIDYKLFTKILAARLGENTCTGGRSGAKLRDGGE